MMFFTGYDYDLQGSQKRDVVAVRVFMFPQQRVSQTRLPPLSPTDKHAATFWRHKAYMKITLFTDATCSTKRPMQYSCSNTLVLPVAAFSAFELPVTLLAPASGVTGPCSSTEPLVQTFVRSIMPLVCSNYLAVNGSDGSIVQGSKFKAIALVDNVWRGVGQEVLLPGCFSNSMSGPSYTAPPSFLSSANSKYGQCYCTDLSRPMKPGLNSPPSYSCEQSTASNYSLYFDVQCVDGPPSCHSHSIEHGSQTTALSCRP